MCLINIIEPKDSKLFEHTDVITAYKVIEGGYSYLFGHEWVQGENYSTRTEVALTSGELEKRQTHKGFHVFLDLEYAKTFQAVRRFLTLIPVKCKKEHFVAEGIGHGRRCAVFTQVTLESTK